MPENAAEAVEIAVIPPAALESLTRAEIDTQVGTARKYRRSVAACLRAAMTMATLDQETAAACSYTLPRDGKMIGGPSIRLAEICFATWGNLRAGSRLIEEGEKTVTAQGFCHDLETNATITTETRRRITSRFGRRYSDDMVNTTANAACAIALRNAIFTVIPGAFVKQIRLAAEKAAAGDEKTLAERREKAVAHFAKLGIDLPRVLARLGGELPKTGIEDVTLQDLAMLHGWAAALRDGEITLDELFPVAQPAQSAAGALVDELAAKSRKKKGEPVPDELPLEPKPEP